MKTRNPQCSLYICKIAPRGDTDITKLNRCIEWLYLHWQKYNVVWISKTYSYFLDKNRLPIEKIFSSDGIHLTHSEVKHLLDAMGACIKIKVDHNLCVYTTDRLIKLVILGGVISIQDRDETWKKTKQKKKKVLWWWNDRTHFSTVLECIGIGNRASFVDINCFNLLSHICIQCNYLNCACNDSDLEDFDRNS